MTKLTSAGAKSYAGMTANNNFLGASEYLRAFAGVLSAAEGRVSDKILRAMKHAIRKNSGCYEDGSIHLDIDDCRKGLQAALRHMIDDKPP